MQIREAKVSDAAAIAAVMRHEIERPDARGIPVRCGLRAPHAGQDRRRWPARSLPAARPRRYSCVDSSYSRSSNSAVVASIIPSLHTVTKHVSRKRLKAALAGHGR